jgi:plastocyanin
MRRGRTGTFVVPRTLAVVAAIGLGGLGLGACGGGSSKSCPAKVDTKTATGGEISVCAGDLHFDVNTIKAAPGPLKVTLVNDGAIYHTFKIVGTPLELKANAGKTATGTVTLANGTYKFECTVSGHAAAGMEGKVVVG